MVITFFSCQTGMIFLISCNLYQALMKFLDKFPQYANNDFYIMGESYAGIYIPTLMKTLSHYPIFSGILKGAAIGNGMLEYRMNFNTMIFFAKSHGLIGPYLWNEILSGKVQFNSQGDARPGFGRCDFGSAFFPLS